MSPKPSDDSVLAAVAASTRVVQRQTSGMCNYKKELSDRLTQSQG